MNSELSGETYKIEEKRALLAEPVDFTGSDFGFAVVMLVCGFLYWNLIRLDSLGAGVSIFAAVLCIITGVYLYRNGMGQTKESVVYLILAALSACNFFLLDNVEIKALNFLFLSLTFVYWVAVSTGRRLERRLSSGIIGDAINQLLYVPFSNLSCGFSGIREKAGSSRHSRSFLNALLGIILFLPVLILVISLLASADAAFERLIDSLRISVSDEILRYVVQVILGIPVACYLFGLIYGDLRGRNTDRITMKVLERSRKALAFVPGITVYSALTLLNLVFLSFFLSQTSYLFSAFGDQLPEAMTYAEYARRGFFELCAVAGINLGVMGAAHLLTRRGENPHDPPKALKIETIALCIFTILLIATALSKMILYINYYGLTQLRVYTTWFMLVLLIVFVIVIIRQFKRFNGTKVAAVSFIICFLVLCYANVDGLIAKYNIDRYREGSLANLDVMALGELSDAAIPYMYDLYQETNDEDLLRSLECAITERSQELQEEPYIEPKKETFRDFNVQACKADRIRAKM